MTPRFDIWPQDLKCYLIFKNLACDLKADPIFTYLTPIFKIWVQGFLILIRNFKCDPEIWNMSPRFEILFRNLQIVNYVIPRFNTNIWHLTAKFEMLSYFWKLTPRFEIWVQDLKFSPEILNVTPRFDIWPQDLKCYLIFESWPRDLKVNPDSQKIERKLVLSGVSRNSLRQSWEMASTKGHRKLWRCFCWYRRRITCSGMPSWLLQTLNDSWRISVGYELCTAVSLRFFSFLTVFWMG